MSELINSLAESPIQFFFSRCAVTLLIMVRLESLDWR